jgi:hypothetical protein
VLGGFLVAGGGLGWVVWRWSVVVDTLALGCYRPNRLVLMHAQVSIEDWFCHVTQAGVRETFLICMSHRLDRALIYVSQVESFFTY